MRAGPTQSRYLRAFIVALNQIYGGNRWYYLSTKELQLASTEFCALCRSIMTLRLTVDAETPRRLLAATDASLNPGERRSTCVPRLRARAMMWGLESAAPLAAPIYALTNVESITFDACFNESLDAVVWPVSLNAIVFRDGQFGRRRCSTLIWECVLTGLF